MTADRVWIALAASLAAFLGAAALGLYLFLKPLASTPIPDWQSTYRALMADGRRKEAVYLLEDAQIAQDPVAWQLMADEIEAGVLPPSPGFADGGVAEFRKRAELIASGQADHAETMTLKQRLIDLRLHLADTLPNGLSFAARDIWLWQHCYVQFITNAVDADKLEAAIAAAEGRAYTPSPRARVKWRCSDRSLVFARALEDGRYGEMVRAQAAEWFVYADIWSASDRYEARVAYAVRILDGRIAAEPYDEPERARRFAAFDLLSAAWHGYVPAQIAAARFLLDRRMPADTYAMETGLGPEGEAYALLLLAKAAGADVAQELAQARARLSDETAHAAEEFVAARAKS